MRLYRTADLPKLTAKELSDYELTVTQEANRLWLEFERVPCPDYLNSWRAFWNDTVDPLVSEFSRRIIAQCAARNGPGGVEI